MVSWATSGPVSLSEVQWERVLSQQVSLSNVPHLPAVSVSFVCLLQPWSPNQTSRARTPTLST